MVNKSKFFKNIGWLMGGKIVNMLLQFFVSLATARYLGPTNLGTIDYVAAYVSFFSSIASLGLNVIIIRDIAKGNGDPNEIVWTAIWMRFGTSILSAVSVVAFFCIKNASEPDIVIIAALESIALLFRAFDTINYYFRAKLLSKWGSISGVLAYMGMSLFRVFLLTSGASIIWFAFATSVDTIFLAVFLLLFYTKFEGFHVKFKWPLGKKLLKQSYHYLISGLIVIVYTQIDRIMLGDMVDKKTVGLYSVAIAISQMWSLLPTSLTESISPVLYDAAKTDRVAYLRRLKQSYALIFWLNALYSIFICIFAKFIVSFLYGEEYLASIGALRIVVWFYGISTMSTLNQVYLANDNKNKYVNYYCIAGLVIDVVLNMLLIPAWGIIGAAIATLITQITIQIIMPGVIKDTREIAICIIKGIFLDDVINADEKKMILERVRTVLNRMHKHHKAW